MTHAEEILKAVAKYINKTGKNTFTRKDIRDELGLTREEWLSGYTAIFQGMRIDHPGGAPNVTQRFKGVFKRIERGKYTLTRYGQQILKEFEN